MLKSIRLTIVTYPDSAAPTFPGPAPLDERALGKCRAAAVSELPADMVWCAPELAARQAAEAMGLTPIVADGLAAPFFGRWAGRSLDDLDTSEAEGLGVWLSNPHAAPHGGESLAALLRRVGLWIDALHEGRAPAVVHPLTARAAATHVLDADPRTIMHLDVPAIGIVRASRTDRWRLQHLGRLGLEPALDQR